MSNRDAEGIERACMQVLDRRHVKQKPGKSNASYVDGYYVKRRLCEIFGPTGWESTAEAELVTVCEIPNKFKTIQYHVTYRATCEITAGGTSHRDVGASTSIDKDLGTAHENAYKGAVASKLAIYCCR